MDYIHITAIQVTFSEGNNFCLTSPESGSTAAAADTLKLSTQFDRQASVHLSPPTLCATLEQVKVKHIKISNIIVREISD